MIDFNPKNIPLEAQLKFKKEGDGRSMDVTL